MFIETDHNDPAQDIQWNRKHIFLDQVIIQQMSCIIYDQALNYEPDIYGTWRNKFIYKILLNSDM